MTEHARLGLPGRLAAAFQDNPLTPVLALLGLLLGLVAVLVTPREEEPQIDVTMANVIVPFQGASARDVEQLVATPLEQKLSEIEGLKHVYSVSRPGVAVLTVEYEVGIERQPAIVRLYNQVFSNQDWLPPGIGVGQPLVKPRGIDDVPVMAVTLWTDDPQRGATELAEVAHTLETEFKRVPGTRDVYTVGAPDRVVSVTLDPAKLAAYGLAVSDLAGALQAANVVHQVGERVGGNAAVPLTAGSFLASADDVANLVVGLADGKPLLLSDVAAIRAGGDLASRYAWYGAPAGRAGPATGLAPAVTIAIAKKPGSNAADITGAITQRLDVLRGELVPEGVHATVTRDYGQTATDKALKLIQKLVFATASVVLLVLFALGWREAIVVGSAVVLTLAMTLFASWAMGFTLNRVSLFALIFSIGILVDDAIVVVENIHRHMALGGKSLREAIPPAVQEVGGPTILATFTVIAALMPMAFVSGLMGPYMRPIPINASVGMLLSLAIALVVTPWLSLKLLARHGDGEAAHQAEERTAGRLHRLFSRVMRPFLDAKRGGRRRLWLFGGMVALVALSASLALFQLVVMKMLPFDNKSEFQVVVDLPEGRTLEDTNALLVELAAAVDQVPEVLDYQGYAGTAAPINFNGLVRQYFLRSGSNVGDLQVNLVDKHERERQSHEIARALRPTLAAIGRAHGASVKVVEVPPGPPVLSPLVAEVYGPDYARSRELGKALEQRFLATEGVVDVDTSVESDAPREVVVVDRARAAGLAFRNRRSPTRCRRRSPGWTRRTCTTAPRNTRGGAACGCRRRPASLQRLLALKVRGGARQLVPLSELVEVRRAPWDGAIHHKDCCRWCTSWATRGTPDSRCTASSPWSGNWRRHHRRREARPGVHRPADDTAVSR